MTEPQQPTAALTEDEQETVRSAALRASALVGQAEPGFFDTFKESFAASKAVKAASPEMQKLVTGGSRRCRPATRTTSGHAPSNSSSRPSAS